MKLPEINSSNEFIAECSNIDLPEFLEIVGSLMDEIKFLHPEKYKEIMGKIRNAKHFWKKLTRRVDTEYEKAFVSNVSNEKQWSSSPTDRINEETP